MRPRPGPLRRPLHVAEHCTSWNSLILSFSPDITIFSTVCVTSFSETSPARAPLTRTLPATLAPSTRTPASMPTPLTRTSAREEGSSETSSSQHFRQKPSCAPVVLQNSSHDWQLPSLRPGQPAGEDSHLGAIRLSFLTFVFPWAQNSEIRRESTRANLLQVLSAPRWGRRERTVKGSLGAQLIVAVALWVVRKKRTSLLGSTDARRACS